MAMDMFLKLGDIKGESVDSKHAGLIDVLAWSWGVSNSGTTHVGGGGGAGKANFQDLSITKYVDSSSSALLIAAASGKHHDKAKLIVRKAGDKPLEYIIIELTEVMVTSVSTGGSGGEDRLTENIVLNFGEIKFSYQPQSKTGGADGGAKIFAWDIAGNEAMG